jgi:uncharacterized protein (TIGR02246 family)
MNLVTSLQVWMRVGLVLLTFILMPLVVVEAQDGNGDQKKAIQAVLDKQIVAWNHGDIEGFMAGYWQSPELIYLSNDKVTRGWQTLLDHYRKVYKSPGAAEMGSLELNEEEINILGADAAIVWGKYRVITAEGKQRGGLYTLAMRKLPEGWRTVYDRTTSEQQ